MARAAVSPWVWAFQLIFFIAPVQSIAFANAPSESHFAKVSLYVSGAENLTSTEVVCKQNESASVAIERHKRLGFADGKLPIWIVYEYSQEEKSHMVELSLLALKQHAPLDRFDIRLVNSSNAHDFIPDMPTVWQKLPDYGAKSDMLRAGLLAHHGGLYVDGDVLFVCDVQGITDLLEHADLVTYASQGQDARRGFFSSNVMAVRPNCELPKRWWEQVKLEMNNACQHPETYEDDLKNGVCCIQPDGKTQRNHCHVPWAGLGELLAHPILASLLSDASTKFQVAFFSEDREKSSFAPDSAGQMLFRQLTAPPASESCNRNSFIELRSAVHSRLRKYRRDSFLDPEQYSGAPCWNPCNSTALVCSDGRSWDAGYVRFAYHLFQHASPPQLLTASASTLVHGDWVVSEFIRRALGPDARAEA